MRRQRLRHRAGERIGRWMLVEPLGCGGNGEVWIAYHTRSNLRCALKLLHNPSHKSEPYRRFQEEVAAVLEMQRELMRSGIPPITGIYVQASSLDEELAWTALQREADDFHRKQTRSNNDLGLAILPITNAHIPMSRDGDRAWYAMPIATPIRAALKGAPVTRTVAAIAQIGTTLAELAFRNVYHRDIKPENLFLYRGRFVIGDFGLVRRPHARDHIVLTATNRVPGPFAYLPNEARSPCGVVNQEKIDVYCLAKTLFVLLTGSPRPPIGHIPSKSQRLYSLAEGGGRTCSFHEHGYLLGFLNGVLGQATDDDPSRRPTLSLFTFELKLALHWHDERSREQEIRVTVHPLIDERVIEWLIARWQSEYPSDHAVLEFFAETPDLLENLSNYELFESLWRLYGLLGQAVGRFGENWADIRPSPWKIDEVAGGAKVMEARIVPVLKAIANERVPEITINFRSESVSVGCLTLKPLDALRLIDYAGDRGWLKFQSRMRSATGVDFHAPGLSEAGKRIVGKLDKAST